jgi:hypothetical protein
MTRMQLSRSQLPLRIGIALALVAGVIFTASYCGERSKAPQRAAGCRRDSAPSTQAELDACLQGFASQGFVFDTAYAASDEQPLAVITRSQGPACPGDTSRTRTLSCRYGPLAKIAPLAGAQNYSEEDLREGRIIAKLSIPEGEKEGYAKYGLIPGQATYWWVRTDKSGTAGTSVFVTATKDGKIHQVRRDLKRDKYEEGEGKYAGYGGKLKRAVARWIWSLDDETAKGTCGAAKC